MWAFVFFLMWHEWQMTQYSWQHKCQCWRIWFPGLWHHLVQREPSVSEENIASTFQKEEWAKQNTSTSRWCLLFQPQSWRPYIPPKHRILWTTQHYNVEDILFIATILRIAVITKCQYCSLNSNLRLWWGMFLGNCFVVLCLPWSMDHLWWIHTKFC